MRNFISAVLLILFPALSLASMSLSWEQPTTNTDGTPLTDLDGNNVYCGAAPGIHTIVVDVGLKAPAGKTVTLSSVEFLTVEGNYYCTVTAYDKSRNESGKSNEVLHPFVLSTPGVVQELKSLETP